MIYRKIVALLFASLLLVSCGGGGGPATTLPEADAGEDLDVVRFASITLDGSASRNADSYRWEQLDGPYVSIENPDHEVQTLRMPALGTYRFRLTAKKGDSVSTDEVRVAVRERPVLVVTSPLEISSTTNEPTVSISGKVSEDIEKIRVVNRTNSATGEAVPDNNGLFSMEGLVLDPGDNDLQVEAIDSKGYMVDASRQVTRTTGVKFTDSLKLSIEMVAAAQKREVFATVSIDAVQPAGNVELVEVDDAGHVLGVVTTLQDNGDITSGDQYRDDGEYSGRFEVLFPKKGQHSYRARVKDGVDDLSNVAVIEAHDSPELKAYEEALAKTGAMVQQSRLGSLSPGTSAFEQAKDDLVRDLRASPMVTTATMAPDRRGIDVVYANGTTNTLVFDDVSQTTGQKAGISPRIATTNHSVTSVEPAVPGSFWMLLFSPLNYGVVKDGICGWDWLYETQNDLNLLSVPPYSYEPLISLVRANDKAKAQNLKDHMQVGILDFLSRGWLVESDGKMVSTLMAEAVTPEGNARYKEDLDAGRMRILGRYVKRQNCFSGEWNWRMESNYLLMPAFFDFYLDRLPNTLVNIQSSQLVDDDNTLANVFLRKGAGAVLGFIAPTTDRHSEKLTEYIMTFLSGENMYLGDAVQYAKHYVGEKSARSEHSTANGRDAVKEELPPSKLRIFGGAGAYAWHLGKTQVADGSFEKGLSGWEPQEHGAQKVVTHWAHGKWVSSGAFGGSHTYQGHTLVPPEGGRMLMLGTVAGEYAGVSQRLHLTEETSYLTFQYAAMQEITEASGIDPTQVPWRQQKLSVVIETEDGVAHELWSAQGKELWFPAGHADWLEDVRCVRISDHVYAENSAAPLCARGLAGFTERQISLTSFRGHTVKLKFLLQDDRSPVHDISDVQDSFVFLDKIQLTDKEMNPIE